MTHPRFFEPLKKYLEEDRPFFGICLGMQTPLGMNRTILVELLGVQGFWSVGLGTGIPSCFWCAFVMFFSISKLWMFQKSLELLHEDCAGPI